MDARELKHNLQMKREEAGHDAATAADEVLQLFQRERINLPVLVALVLEKAGYQDDEITAAVNRQRFQQQAGAALADVGGRDV